MHNTKSQLSCSVSPHKGDAYIALAWPNFKEWSNSNIPPPDAELFRKLKDKTGQTTSDSNLLMQRRECDLGGERRGLQAPLAGAIGTATLWGSICLLANL